MKRIFADLLLLLFVLVGAPAHAQFDGCGEGFCNNPPAYVLVGASVDIDFANGRSWPAALESMVSVSRATPDVAYAQRLDGTLVGFAPDTLRVTDQGALIEEARTNSIVQSQTFDISWVKSSVTVTANQIAAPDGTTTADLYTSIGATDSLASPVFGVAASSVVTGSVYFKRGNTDWVRIIVAGPSATNGFQAWANSATGALGVLSARGAGTATSSSIAALGDGWYRLSVTGVASTDTNLVLTILSSTANGGGAAGTGATINLWGAQAELGAFPTSYIPTTTVAATRAADVPQLIGPGLLAGLNAKAAFFQTLGVSGTFPRFLSFNTNTNGMFFNNSTTIGIQSSIGVGTVPTIGGGGTSAGTVKAAFGFDAVSMTAIANNGIKGTQAGGFDNGTAAWLGNVSGSGNRALNGYMQRFALSSIKGAFDGMTAP